MLEIGARLRDCRKEKELTQQKMADILEISLNAYQKYEQNERFPTPENLVKIADTFGVSLDYLLMRDDFIESTLKK